MLTREQEKLIRSLATKKGRESSGFCLVEGKKTIETAGSAVEYVFDSSDTPRFSQLVTTETPQALAAVARIPQWGVRDIVTRDVIVVLDGVQDPGNVGSILRLCLGYDASLVLIESADVTSPKVVRSSVGAIFQVPWMRVARVDALNVLKEFNRLVYRLEKVPDSKKFDSKKITRPCLLVAGSEGSGIQLSIQGESVVIFHNDKLESLNVGHALAIALFEMAHYR
ncbi:MAG: RNA methyltransferase [bacterium]|nr:RNA methyltransferase [bacterium]